MKYKVKITFERPINDEDTQFCEYMGIVECSSVEAFMKYVADYGANPTIPALVRIYNFTNTFNSEVYAMR